MESSGSPESRLSSNHELLFRVGIVLDPRDSLTMGELSDALSVPLSTATRVVNVLVGHGYVERRHDPDDRRVVRVSLTQRGRELFQFIDSRIVQRVRRIASYLSESEMATLISLFTKVASAVEETLD
jgi:DNA-binding MarR family transcriptional regulator